MSLGLAPGEGMPVGGSFIDPTGGPNNDAMLTGTLPPAPAIPASVYVPNRTIRSRIKGAYESVGTISANVFSTRRRIGVAALALTVVAIFGGREVLAANNNSSSTPTLEAGMVGITSGSQTIETCEAGLFPDGAFASWELAAQTNHELHERPQAEINGPTTLNEYLFGKKGVVCNNAPTLAALAASVTDILGAGNSAVGFSTTDPNEILKKYLADEKGQTQAEIDIKIVKKAFENAQPADEPIVGPMYRIGGEETGDPNMPAQVILIKEAVSFDPADIKVLEWRTVINDLGEVGNEGQKIVFYKPSGQFYLLKAIGAPVRDPNDAGEQTVDTTGGAGNNSANTAGTQNNTRGGRGKKPGQGQGDSNTGGAAGPNGDNPEAGPGGTTPSPATGGTPGTAPGTPGTPPATPPEITTTTTRPNTSTTVVTTTTTIPRTTTTIPQTTTTSTTSTTSTPPTTKGTVPCDPNIAKC